MATTGETLHVFYSAGGDVLPRWREAFPAAQGVAIDAPQTAAPAPSLRWLRLRMGTPASQQIAEFRSRAGNAALIVMSDLPDDDEALAAFSAAAKGYCNTNASPEVLRQIADVVLQGGVWIGESLMQRLLTATARAVPAASAPESWAAMLTDREKEVALAIAAGASNKEIAARLGITERTVKMHVGSLLGKLEVRDRLQLALLVQRQGKTSIA